MSKRTRVIILDGQNLVHRYESMQGKSRWAPASLVFNHLFWIFEKLQPDIVITAWEGLKSRDPRKKLFEAYKSDRDRLRKKEKKVRINSKKLAQWVQQHLMFNFPIHQIKEDFLEADDTISQIVEYINNTDKYDAVIVSTDKDFHQLVSSRVAVYNPITKKILTEQTLKELYGIRNLRNVAWLKAIMGDDSDSIPGIKGIGLKTAQKLLHPILNSEAVWEAQEVADLLAKKKEISETELKTYWEIIQLQWPLNVKAAAKLKQKIEWAFSNLPKYNEKKLIEVYAQAHIYRDIKKEFIQRKLLILSEFMLKQRRGKECKEQS